MGRADFKWGNTAFVSNSTENVHVPRIFQDIIGSNRFKKPLAILSDRIERLKDIRLEKLARVKAVEKEKNDLQMVRNEALTYLRLLNKITRIKNVIYQKNQYRELTDESNLRNQLVDVEKQLEVSLEPFVSVGLDLMQN